MSIEKPITFEQYLQDKHAETCQCLDDEMPDNFSEWLEDMGVDEIIEYAEKWHISLKPKCEMSDAEESAWREE